MNLNPCLSMENNSNHSDFLHAIEVAGYRYVILTICIFGIVCNILNLCVLLQRRRLKESPYTYLTGLAIADMLTLISISPFSLVRGDYIHQENILFALTRFEAEFYMPLANYFGQVSIMITVALTIERYLFTTYPLRTQSFCKPRYARLIIVIILFICAILSFPRFLFTTVQKIIGPIESFPSSHCATHPFLIPLNATNSSHSEQCFCIERYVRPSFASYQDAYYITMFIFNQILPGLILLLLNVNLIRRVQHSNRYTLRELVARQHCQLPSSTPAIHPIKQKRLREEHRLTKTLVAIVVVFLVCNTFTIISYPTLIKVLTEKRYPKYFHRGFRIQILVTNMMLLLNYSINFFFYCAFNQKFMDTLRFTFRHRFCSYAPVNVYQQNDSLSTQRTLLKNATLLAHSSLYSHSRIQNSSRYSPDGQEENSQDMNSSRKGFRLRTFKSNHVRR